MSAPAEILGRQRVDEGSGGHSRYSQVRPTSRWREHHGWSVVTSLRRLRSRPLETWLTLMVMGLSLVLPLLFYLLLGNVQRLGNALGRNPVISVFLQPNQSASVAQGLVRQLRARSDVNNVTLKTPQQGLDELSKMQGFSSVLSDLVDNPLPYVVQVQAKDSLDVAAMNKLVAELRGFQGVDSVQDSGHWRQRLDAFLVVGERAVVLLTILLTAVALLAVGNTVRMDIVSRVEEIQVQMLVGASPPFVRRPYLYAGIWYGLFSGTLAVLIILLMEWSLAGPVAHLIQVYAGRLIIRGLPWQVLLGVPVAAAVLGWLGARLVSARCLRRSA